MAIPSDARDQLALKFEVLLPHLNERQRRLLLAAEARLLGHGGVRAVAQVAGVSESTVRKGVFELEEGQNPFPDGRARREGGGRRSAEELDSGLVPALLALVEPDERGDPESPLRWTTKSLRHLAGELARRGHPVSAPTAGRLLRGAGFSLQANAKTLEGAQHPDRDAQFRYINEQVKDHQAGGEPVISVDTKKREQLGRLPMAGREWRPKGEPVQVEDHSFFFTGPDVEQAIPYGIYDISRGTGWVNVGTDHDTLGFRGGVHPPLVAGAWPGRLPGRLAPADHGGRRRIEQLPVPRLEERTGRLRGGDRAGDHGLPFPRHLEVEQDRAPAVLAHHHELAGTAPDQPRGGRPDDRGDPHQQRPARRGHLRPRRLPHRRRHQQRTLRRPAAGTARRARRLELHPPPGGRRPLRQRGHRRSAVQPRPPPAGDAGQAQR